VGRKKWLQAEIGIHKPAQSGSLATVVCLSEQRYPSFLNPKLLSDTLFDPWASTFLLHKRRNGEKMCEVMLACGWLDLQGSPDCYFDSGAERVTKSIISYRTGRPKLRNWSSMLAFRLVYCCFCVSSCDIPGDICWASGCYTVHAAGYTHSPHVSKQAMRSQFFKITLFCSFRHVYTPFMLLNCKRWRECL